MSSSLSQQSSTDSAGNAFKDRRPIIPREPIFDPETGFDNADETTYFVMPVSRGVKDAIFKDYLKLTQDTVDDTQAIITIAASRSLLRGRVTAIVHMRLEEERMRRAGDELYDEVQEFVDLETMIEAQELASGGIKIMEANDFLVETGWDSRKYSGRQDPGFELTSLTEEEIGLLEKKMLEREGAEELDRREVEKLLRKKDQKEAIAVTEVVSDLMESTNTRNTRDGEADDYTIKGNKRWVMNFKNVVSQKQKKKGMSIVEDCLTLDTKEDKQKLRVMRREEFKETSWGGRKMRGLWMSKERPITKQL
jgi:hypothetical protein